jgi:hypothetical protein
MVRFNSYVVFIAALASDLLCVSANSPETIFLSPRATTLESPFDLESEIVGMNKSAELRITSVGSYNNTPFDLVAIETPGSNYVPGCVDQNGMDDYEDTINHEGSLGPNDFCFDNPVTQAKVTSVENLTQRKITIFEKHAKNCVVKSLKIFW